MREIIFSVDYSGNRTKKAAVKIISSVGHLFDLLSKVLGLVVIMNLMAWRVLEAL